MNPMNLRPAPGWPTYRADVALELAELSVAVYRDDVSFCGEVRSAGYDDAQLLEVGATQAGICWTQGRELRTGPERGQRVPPLVVVVFRGSSERRDWIDDVSICRVRWRDVVRGSITFGFRQQIRRISDLLLTRLREVLERLADDAFIYVCGHSLGGALVPLGVALLSSHGIGARVAYAFNMPRVGNRHFAAWYDRKFTEADTPTYRVVNVVGGEIELVTRVPKSSWGFWHLGIPQIVVLGGQRFEERALWEAYREENPVGNLQAWRVISRTFRAAGGHGGPALLRTLRDHVDAARA